MTLTSEPSPRPRKAKVTPSPDKPIGIVLVDDNRLLREGLASLLGAQPSFKVLAALGGAEAALETVQMDQPDVVLIDVGFDGEDPLRLSAEVHKVAPQARVVLKGLPPSQTKVAHYLRAGVTGFIMKDDSIDELSETLRCVAAGCQVLPPPILSLLADQVGTREVTLPTLATIDAMRLTSREKQVVKVLGEGLCNKDIAKRLGLSVHTVKSHIHNILEKLALHSRLEVVAYAHSHPAPEEL